MHPPLRKPLNAPRIEAARSCIHGGTPSSNAGGGHGEGGGGLSADRGTSRLQGQGGSRSDTTRRTLGLRGLATAAALLVACASPTPSAGPERYRLQASGPEWRENGNDAVFADVQTRYPDFFDAILDPSMIDDEPPRSDLVEDLERHPPDRASYDALNAVAIAYYEMNWRGELAREAGEMDFLAAGFASAKLAGIPWRAYGEIEDPALRGAILDFFEDVVTGEKRGSRRTRGRLERIVADLREKEPDAALGARIDRLLVRYRAALADDAR